jgi:hypothetical protein
MPYKQEPLMYAIWVMLPVAPARLKLFCHTPIPVSWIMQYIVSFFSITKGTTANVVVLNLMSVSQGIKEADLCVLLHFPPT